MRVARISIRKIKEVLILSFDTGLSIRQIATAVRLSTSAGSTKTKHRPSVCDDRIAIKCEPASIVI